jgi:uncharacterized protein involved in exopolysaccharide biosynthesis
MWPAEFSLSLPELCRALLRHRRKVLLFVVLVLGLTAAVTALGPRTYRSQSKLFVRLGRENATLDSTATLGQGPVVAVPTTREAELNSVLEMLLSRSLLTQVVDAVGPEAVLGKAPPAPVDGPVPPAPEEERDGTITDRYLAVEKLGKMIKVEAVRKSNVVVITCDGPSPELCETVLARLVAFYLDQHVRLFRTPGAFQFLKEQSARMHAQVRRTEEELRDLKNETGLASPEAQRQVLVARIGRLEDELLQAGAAAAATEAEVRALRDKLAGVPATVVTAHTRGAPNHAADLMRGQLYTLQLKEMELLARHAEHHPEVKLVRRQAAAAKELLAKEAREREQVTTGPNKVHEEVEVTRQRQEAVLASLRARAEALRGQLERERAALKTLNANELRVARLQRKLDLEASQHRRYAEGLEQGQIDRALVAERISNVSVVQPPSYDPKPVRPRKLINLAVGLAVALSGGLGLAVLAEYLRRSRAAAAEVVATHRQVELTPVPERNGAGAAS